MDKKDILSQFEHDDGRRVPDGYFADFETRMMAMLPEQPWEKSDTDAPVVLEAPRTWWQRLRPYVYMAAMFAGIWCMMNIFSITSPATPEQMLDQNPVLAEALTNDSFVDDLDLDTDDTDWDAMMDDLYQSGITAADLRTKLQDGTL